ncbi:hypothetical protein J2S43_003007 [Catenuloplanes nepalensis]|uniref:Uncharacterized protein n=1 Tax=Catenuloplanes nepalensis TaxID=587533 RepID=A0ABT9MST1_9ACTN|nr:hypothetical protein [Catenuloplanes nepalensis]MDP9794495.1 hypothetical protein [Catenuloplanes nepalensis]
MAAAGAAIRGLTPDELHQIKQTLAGGRKPKVMFTESAGQIAGQIGQVIELQDPETSEEYVVVRFGRDELPFSPADLTIPPKGATGRKAPEPEPEVVPEPAAPEPEFMVVRERPVPEKKTEEQSTVTETPEAAKPPVKKAAAKAVKPKGPAGLTVTLAYDNGEWTVAAQQGTKALAKPYVVKPAEALKIVALVDVPGVHEAVEAILSSERAEAEQQAEKLRAELAEVEARLAELRDV